MPDGLKSIIDEPGDGDSVASALETINNTRCCNVLPALDSLWQDSADQEGIAGKVNTVVPRPDACSSVQC